MKTRNGFVSNSSSSSFICDSCGYEDGGFEAGLSDVRMVEYVCGHIICESHINFNSDSDRYEWPSEDCPCCNLDNVSNETLYAYAFHLLGKTKKEIKKEIKSKFKTDADVWKEIRGEDS